MENLELAVGKTDGRLDGRACQWCSEPAAGEVEVEPARFGTRKGLRVCVQRAKLAYVCTGHISMIMRETHLRGLRKERAALLKKLADSGSPVPPPRLLEIECELEEAGDLFPRVAL